MARETGEIQRQKVEAVKQIFATDPLTSTEKVLETIARKFRTGITPSTVSMIRQMYGFKIGPRGKVIELKTGGKASGSKATATIPAQATPDFMTVLGTVREWLVNNGYVSCTVFSNGAVTMEQKVSKSLDLTAKPPEQTATN